MRKHYCHLMLGCGMLYVELNLLCTTDPVCIYAIEVLSIHSDNTTTIPKEWLVARGYYKPLCRSMLAYILEHTDYQERLQFDYDAQY